MAHEIDFIGTDKVSKDYDAIAFRFKSNGRFVNCVFDGGTLEACEALETHLKAYYINLENPKLDYVFCSHSDTDHSSGLRTILENFKVKNLVMNRPWEYLDDLYKKVSDGRITRESLEKTLREKYSMIDELEKLAKEKGVNIVSGVSGVVLAPEMMIMSPAKDFYIELLAESEKTPNMAANNKSLANSFASVAKSAMTTLAKLINAVWGHDDIREGLETTPENEMSIVLRVDPPEDKPFLLVGDAGCRALTKSLEYAEVIAKPLNECAFLQMPHHGGRHNVSPSVLDKLIGVKVAKGTGSTKTSYVSVGKDSDHPRKCVKNAFINRGCAVYVASSETKWHHHDMPSREGWSAAVPESYSNQVEDWD